MAYRREACRGCRQVFPVEALTVSRMAWATGPLCARCSDAALARWQAAAQRVTFETVSAAAPPSAP